MTTSWKHTFAAIVASVAFGLAALLLLAMALFAGMGSSVAGVLFSCWAAAVGFAAVGPWVFGAEPSRLRLFAAFAIVSIAVSVVLGLFAEGSDVAFGLAALLAIGAAATERVARLAWLPDPDTPRHPLS